MNLNPRIPGISSVLHPTAARDDAESCLDEGQMRVSRSVDTNVDRNHTARVSIGAAQSQVKVNFGYGKYVCGIVANEQNKPCPQTADDHISLTADIHLRPTGQCHSRISSEIASPIRDKLGHAFKAAHYASGGITNRRLG